MTTTTALSVYRYLNQGTIWCPKPPAEPLAIADMDLPWRFNAAQLLLRRAAQHADAYGWSEISTMTDAPDEVVDSAIHNDGRRRADPQTWLRTTSLYRALVAALPVTTRRLTAVAETARHWSTCPARQAQLDCTCGAGPIADRDSIAAIITVVKDIRAAKARAAAAEAEEKRIRAEAAARLAWMVEHPGLDPETLRPWGVDEDGVNHYESHSPNDRCHFDSCWACGGYHCGLFCADSRGGDLA